MTESTFIKRNGARWKTFDGLLERGGRGGDPDVLAELFVQITDDLSYARTFYPHSTTTAYLNTLAAKAHQAIYKRRKEGRDRFLRFWRDEVPLELYRARKELLYSFLFFGVAALIGIVSTANDADFARSVLGNDYIDMTLENIADGNPMGVYASQSELRMFVQITLNNIFVSFYHFIFGAAFSVGTLYLLLKNGMMIGVFHTFLHGHGLLFTSLLAVYVHGTIEIASIVVAGAAGLVLGNSLLFPGTYTRRESVMRGARRGMKIVVGLVPFFIVAGFLESFVTRYTTMPLMLNIAIIALSLALVVTYFIIWPARVARRVREETAGEGAVGTMRI